MTTVDAAKIFDAKRMLSSRWSWLLVRRGVTSGWTRAVGRGEANDEPRTPVLESMTWVASALAELPRNVRNCRKSGGYAGRGLGYRLAPLVSARPHRDHGHLKKLRMDRLLSSYQRLPGCPPRG